MRPDFYSLRFFLSRLALPLTEPFFVYFELELGGLADTRAFHGTSDQMCEGLNNPEQKTPAARNMAETELEKAQFMSLKARTLDFLTGR